MLIFSPHKHLTALFLSGNETPHTSKSTRIESVTRLIWSTEGCCCCGVQSRTERTRISRALQRSGGQVSAPQSGISGVSVQELQPAVRSFQTQERAASLRPVCLWPVRGSSRGRYFLFLCRIRRRSFLYLWLRIFWRLALRPFIAPSFLIEFSAAGGRGIIYHGGPACKPASASRLNLLNKI